MFVAPICMLGYQKNSGPASNSKKKNTNNADNQFIDMAVLRYVDPVAYKNFKMSSLIS